MLIGQASINLSANVLSALLGLLSVFIFTRLFSPHDYGVYLLGMAFAAVVSVFLAGWFRNLIMSRHARDDGTDVRGLVVSGYLIGCLAAPAAYGLGRLVGLDAMEALAAVGLAVAIGVFELTQELVRAKLMVVTAMKATLVRAVAALCLGVAAAFLGKTGILLLVSSTLAYLLAVLVQRSAWRGTVLKFDGAGLLNAAKQGLPLTLSLTLLAISSVADRFIIANLASTADAGTICRRSRPGPAGRDDAGVQHRRRVRSAGDPDQRQSGNRRGAIASRRMRRIAAVRDAAGMPGLRGHFFPHRQRGARRRFPRDRRRDDADRGRRRDIPDPDAAISAHELPAVGPQFLLSDQHRVDHRGQRGAVIRPDQRLRHDRRGLGTAWRRSVRLRLRPGPQPPGLSDPVSAAADRTGCHRRIDHGAAGGGRRPTPAGFRSDRVLRPVGRRNRQLRGCCAGCSTSHAPAAA